MMTRFGLAVAVAVLAFFGAVPLSGCGSDKDDDKKPSNDVHTPANAPSNQTDVTPSGPKEDTVATSAFGDFTLAVTSGNQRLMLNSKESKNGKEFVFTKKNPSDAIEPGLKKFEKFSAAIEFNSVNVGRKRKDVNDSMKNHLIFSYSPVVVKGLKHRMTQLFTNEAAKAASVVDTWGGGIANALRKLTPAEVEAAIKEGGNMPDDFPTEVKINGEILYNLLHTFTEGWDDLKNKGYKNVIKKMTEVIENETTKDRPTDSIDLDDHFMELFAKSDDKAEEKAKKLGNIHEEIMESGNLSHFDILNSAFLYVGKDLLRAAVGTDAPEIYASPAVELSNNDDNKKLERIETFDDLVPDEAIKAKAGFAVLFLNKNKCVAFLGINSDSKYTDKKTKEKKEGLSKQVKNVMTLAKEKCTDGGVAYLMGDFGLLSEETLDRFIEKGKAKLSDGDDLKDALKKVKNITRNFYSECRQGTSKDLSPRTKSEENDKVYEKIKPYDDYKELLEPKFDDLAKLEVASDKQGVMVIPIHQSTFKSIEGAEKGGKDMMNNPVLRFDIKMQGVTKKARVAPSGGD